MSGGTHHIMGISGGKDSSALAIYLRDKVPDLTYFFCDTGAELPETYEYLARLEAYFGRPIVRLNSGRDFDHWLDVFRGALPSATMRWCTRQMKIKPLEDWVADEFGDDQVISYVAIRADEPQREGYLSTRSNIAVKYPFREDNIDKEGVFKILQDSGVGLPAYYEWRTRSGCYFCFFQRKAEWVGLADRHPDLFARAVEYEEKANRNHGSYGSANPYTWAPNEALPVLLERKDEVLAKHEEALAREKRKRRNLPLLQVIDDAFASDDDSDGEGCQVCHV